MKTSLLKKLFADIIALLTGFTCIVHTTNGQVFKLVKDIAPGAGSSYPKNLTNANDMLYLSIQDASSQGGKLFKSDGTTAGTVLVKDLGFKGTHSINSITNVNGTLFFIESYRSGGPGISVVFKSLWKSDGTANGTVKIYPGSPSPYVFKILGNVNSILYFTNRTGLYKSDGTAAGTALVKNFTGAVSYDLGSYTNINGTLYFSAIDSAHGDELWKSDGTAVGTVLVKDIYTGILGSIPSNFANVNSTLYFSAQDSAHGMELWKSNGTAAGTVLVKDIYPGGSCYPYNLTNVNGTLYFSATDFNGLGLWKSDGTTAGTVLIKYIYPGFINSSIYNFTNINGTLYFIATDSTYAKKLWKSNGTANGTVLVKDIGPGINGSIAGDLTNVNGILYFYATDATHGTELWKSDGTSAGTVLVQDIEPGTGSSNPENITVVNGITFLTAVTKQYGAELYSGSTPAASAKTLPVSFVAASNEVLTNKPVQLKIAPNPVLNSTTISFALSQSQKVSISIYDMNGRLIKTLADEKMQQGIHKLTWNTTDWRGSAVNSGIYFLRMQKGDFLETNKLVVVQ